MAQQDIENMFAALKQAAAERESRASLSILAAKQKEEAKHNTEASKLAREKFTTESKAASAIHDLMLLNRRLAGLPNPNETSSQLSLPFQTGLSNSQIPGEQRISEANSPNMPLRVANSFLPNFDPSANVLHTFRDSSGRDINQVLPNPIENAKRIAMLEEITKGPTREHDLEKIQLQGDLRASQAEALNLREMMRAGISDKRADLDRASREKIAEATNKSRERTAGMRKLLPVEWQNTDTSQHVDDAFNGDLSIEVFKGLPYPPLLKASIIDEVQARGGTFLSKDQQKVASEFVGLVDIVSIIDKLLDVIPKTTGSGKISGIKSGIVGAANTFNEDITNLEKRLEGHATQVGRAISKDNRVSDKDAERVGMGYFPKKNGIFSYNVEKREDFVRAVNKAIDAKLSTIPLAQRENIKNKLGLNTIKPYGSVGSASPTTLSPAASPTTLSPAAKELLKRHGIPLPTEVN